MPDPFVRLQADWSGAWNQQWYQLPVGLKVKDRFCDQADQEPGVPNFIGTQIPLLYQLGADCSEHGI